MELKQHITDEKTGIGYTLQGDYYLPDLVFPEQESFSVGKYGRMHRRYLKERHKAYYSTLLTFCKLAEHLHEADELCNALMERLTKQLAKQEGVTEALKLNTSPISTQCQKTLSAFFVRFCGFGVAVVQ